MDFPQQISQDFEVVNTTTTKDQLEAFWDKTRKRNNMFFLKDYIHDIDYAGLVQNIPYHLFEDPDLVEESND